MTCEVVKLPNGETAIICGPRQRARRSCGAPANRLCDFAQPQKASGTCDKPLCTNCAVSAGPDRDFCPDHALAGAQLSMEV